MTQSCVLSDGRPGHFNQSLGILAATAPGTTGPRVIDLPATRRVLKHLVLLGILLAGHHAGLLRRLYRFYYRGDLPTLDDCGLLVSTGGDTLVASIVIARLRRCPNVFIGKRSPFTDHGVDLVFAAEGEDVPGRVVVLDFGPMNVPPVTPPARKDKPETIAVLVGGDSNEYRYAASDYTALADALNRLCARTGVRLLLTTSRRTGSAGEAILRERIAPEHLADATWYGSAPRPVTRDYCLRADAILCSEDSGTMLTETIHYARPVIAFHPETRRLTPFYTAFLARLAGKGVRFGSIPALAALDPGGVAPAVPPTDMQRISAALAALSGKHSPATRQR